MTATRWGLCCLSKEEPIHFGIRQATHLAKFDRNRQLEMVPATILANGHALLAAIAYCADAGIGAFRVNSRIFPLKTPPPVPPPSPKTGASGPGKITHLTREGGAGKFAHDAARRASRG